MLGQAFPLLLPLASFAHGLGANKTDDLTSYLHKPRDTRIINARSLLRTQDEHPVELLSGIVLGHYSLSDRMAEAYALVNLVKQGWATQQEVARALCCSARTVRWDQQRFEDGSPAALGHPGGYPKGQPRLSAARSGWTNCLKAHGHSHREIARRAGIIKKALREVLRRLG